MFIKIDMHESEESKMARFVSGLKRDIQDMVELHEYSSLENLVHLAIKVESQLSKKASFQKPHNDGFYHTSWTNNQKSTSTFPSNFKKESTYKTKDLKPSPSTPISPTMTSSKKCFKCLGFGHIATNCPTKRLVMVKGDQVVSEHSDNSSRPKISPVSMHVIILSTYSLKMIFSSLTCSQSPSLKLFLKKTQNMLFNRSWFFTILPIHMEPNQPT